MEAKRAADRDHELTDTEAVGVAQLRDVEAAALGAKHGEIRQRIRADDLGAERAAIEKRRLDAGVGVGHDVCRAQQVAVGRAPGGFGG